MAITLILTITLTLTLTQLTLPPGFVDLYPKVTNYAVLRKTTPMFSVPSIVFTTSLLMALQRAELLVMR